MDKSLSIKLPENVCDLQCFRFCAVNNVHFSEIFSVNVDGTVLFQIVIHSLKYNKINLFKY